MKKIILAAVFLPTFGFAGDVEYDERQTKILAYLTPEIQKQVEGDAGVSLSQCVVETAKWRELRKLAKADAGADAELDPKITAIINDVLQRPTTLECLTRKLSK